MPIDRDIAELAGRIRRRHNVRTPDALIAACALSRNLTLVTRNVKGFAGITDLTIRAAI